MLEKTSVREKKVLWSILLGGLSVITCYSTVALHVQYVDIHTPSFVQLQKSRGSVELKSGLAYQSGALSYLCQELSEVAKPSPSTDRYFYCTYSVLKYNMKTWEF